MGNPGEAWIPLLKRETAFFGLVTLSYHDPFFHSNTVITFTSFFFPNSSTPSPLRFELRVLSLMEKSMTLCLFFFFCRVRYFFFP